MARKILQLGAVLGALSVILGAFTAHTLKNHLSPESLEIFQIGVRYQFYHTFAILLCGTICLQNPHRFFRYAAIGFCLGILCFSGSLYLLASRYALGIASWTWLGPITPIGGLLFIVGWLFFLFGASKIKRLQQ